MVFALLEQLGPAQGQGSGEGIGPRFKAPQGLEPGDEIGEQHEAVAAGVAEGALEVEPAAVTVPTQPFQLPVGGLQLVAPVVRFVRCGGCGGFGGFGLGIGVSLRGPWAGGSGGWSRRRCWGGGRGALGKPLAGPVLGVFGGVGLPQGAGATAAHQAVDTHHHPSGFGQQQLHLGQGAGGRQGRGRAGVIHLSMLPCVEASSLPSLSPWLQAADQWHEVLLLLPVLVGLELVLSADNAIALAAIARRLPDADEQRRALNLGLLFALVFRIVLIVAARWVLAFPPLLAAGALYLLWLCGSHFLGGDAGGDEGESTETDPSQPSAEPAHRSLAATAITLALADLAFSLDSVAAAVAVSDRLALVITGGVVGVLALRLSSGWVLQQLERYPRLESAGYAAVGLVGVQLLLRLVLPAVDVPEWLLLAAVVLLVAWSLQGEQEQAG